MGLRSFSVKSLAGSAKNFTVSAAKVPILLGNRLAGTQNNSFFGSKSEGVGHHANVSSVNFTAMQEHGALAERSVSKEQEKVAAGFVGRVQVPILKEIRQKTAKGCDLTKGHWVFDESYPLYAKGSCPFIDEGFDCEGNGRLDRNYSKWKWQPKDCDFPRYSHIQSFETFLLLLHLASLVILGLSLGILL